MQTRLSVNVNKIATLRNARGGNVPDLLRATKILLKSGVDGITVHPRPDARHITYQDVHDLKALLDKYNGLRIQPHKEFNIEGNPTPTFLELVEEVRPDQVTLVPDAPDALTSNAGWDTVQHADFLRGVVERLHSKEIRVSIFVDPVLEMIDGAKAVGTDRVELYTEQYAREGTGNLDRAANAVYPYRKAAARARELELEVNAGHDLCIQNLNYFLRHIPYIREVSIGQALISEALLYWGLSETVQRYKRIIRQSEPTPSERLTSLTDEFPF